MTAPAKGSGILEILRPRAPHLAEERFNNGVQGELNLLRATIRSAFKYAAVLWAAEYTNPAVADVDAFVLAVTPEEAAGDPLVYEEGTALPLDGVLASGAIPYGRNVTATTVGADTEFVFPFSVVFEGEDMDGKDQSETLTFTSGTSPGTIAGAKIFTKITKVTIPNASAPSGVGTVSVGFGALLGMDRAPVSRAGLVNVVREVAAGSVVTNGTFSAANRSYSPNSAPDGSRDYYLLYEIDVTAERVKITALPQPRPAAPSGAPSLAYSRAPSGAFGVSGTAPGPPPPDPPPSRAGGAESARSLLRSRLPPWVARRGPPGRAGAAGA
jgi:hypothetical protein